jgi:hypothetical protein
MDRRKLYRRAEADYNLAKGADANSMSIKALAIQIGGYVLVGWLGSPVC